MGRIAADLADKVTVSSDNPRGEDPDAIIAQILPGIPRGARLYVEADRARAIMQTIWAADPDDVVLLAGKGHETYRSEEHTSELQSLMRISYAVFCLKKKKKQGRKTSTKTLP